MLNKQCIGIGTIAAAWVFFAAIWQTATVATAGTKVVLGRRRAADQQIAVASVNHAAWDALLRKYVDARGDVDYTTWKATPADLRALDEYLAHLSQARASRTDGRSAQMAFWINAYNAVTVKGILREYPTTSIRNHTAKLFGYNIWDDLLLTTPMGQFSLNQMEHEILRKMGDHRIHFAIVCASKGCPRLLNQAYTAASLDTQLTANARNFFADRTKFNYDAERRTLHVSPILKWFAEDFGLNQQQQIRTIVPYLPDMAAQRLAASGAASVSYLDYDWGLNDRKP